MFTAGRPRLLIALLSTVALWLGLGHVTVAHAAPISYQFTGTITTADVSTGFAPGAQFSGSFIYDNAVDPSDYLGGTATYSQPFGSPYSGGPGMTFAVGGQDIMKSSFLNVTTTDYPSPRVGFMGVGPSLSNGNRFRTELELMDPTGLSYGSYGPTSTLSLANFSKGLLNVTWSHDDITQLMFAGTVTSLTATPVPEPTAATLLCFAAVGWLAHSRRRQTRSA